MNPIYKPAGRALEYSPDALACNIYRGCTHGCSYCFAPSILRVSRESFHASATLRAGIVEAVKRQIDREQITDKLIHLCFTCDPYPAYTDTRPTREVIKAIKDSGNHVQILTKAGGCGERAERDFDLLDGGDWFGVSITGADRQDEPNAQSPMWRSIALQDAYKAGIKTWVSCEPVLNAERIYDLIGLADYIDLFRIGKLNHRKSDIDWGAFGRECVRLCEKYGRNYYIKDDLRREMGLNG